MPAQHGCLVGGELGRDAGVLAGDLPEFVKHAAQQSAQDLGLGLGGSVPACRSGHGRDGRQARRDGGDIGGQHVTRPGTVLKKLAVLAQEPCAGWVLADSTNWGQSVAIAFNDCEVPTAGDTATSNNANSSFS